MVRYRNIILSLEEDTRQGPLEESEILQVERAIGLELTKEYRDFLQATNGGDSDKNNASSKRCRAEFAETGSARGSPADSYYLDGFFIAEVLPIWHKDLHKMSESPLVGLMPIALVQGCQDLILIGVAGEHTGKVYGWFTPENVEDNDSIYLLADGFNEFLDSLQNNRQDGARYATAEGFEKEVKVCKSLLKERKDDPVWVAYGSRGLAYEYAMLGNFSEALTYLKAYFDVMKKEGFAHDYVGEYGACDWDHYIEYLELARQEKAAGREDWRIRFADRLSFVDPDNNPYPYPG